MADQINISPDMIDNLVNMLKNSNLNNNTSSNSNNEKSVDSNNSNQQNNSNSFNNLDLDTIMKIKSVIDSLNTQNDRNSNLLYSLKPYLRKSRQDKLDQYINILKISQVQKLFNNKLGDEK